MIEINLALSETIYIGDNTKIIVLSIKGSRVDIGIKAPKTIPVYREEIYNRIHKKVQDHKGSANHYRKITRTYKKTKK